MKWDNFLRKVKEYPYFGESIFTLHPRQRATLRNQLTRWAGKGRIWRLRKGLYSLPFSERKTGLSLRLASNVIYSPSYVSLDFILSHSQLIPEKVPVITAITSLKTASFKNPLGTFTYRKIKKEIFTGFSRIKDEFGFPVFVATPEKALLDKIYLDSYGEITKKYLLENLRLQNLSLLKTPLMKRLSMKFRSRKIDLAVKLINQLRAEEL